MLSQTVEYALRAVLHIAADHPRCVRVNEIADAVDVPRNYLAKILGNLARVGVLESARGPTGGFRLGRDPADVRLSEVVAVFESAMARQCLRGHGRCGSSPACTAHARWAPIATAMDEFCAATTLADLLLSPTPFTEVSVP